MGLLINNTRSCAASSVPRMVAKQSVDAGMNKVFSTQKNYFTPPAFGGGSRSVIWWIDRILILLAVILFLMTVTAQLCIHLQLL